MARADADSPSGSTRASGGRAALAGMIDVAVMGAAHLLYTRWLGRGGRDGRNVLRRGQRWTRVVGPAKTILEEQIGTPGGWIVGVRTVDARTGQRVALWRTLAIAFAGVATRELGRRVRGGSPPITDVEHEWRARELRAIHERYRDDPDARNAALAELCGERQVNARLSRGPTLAAAGLQTLVSRRLRRRLAPTVVVDARGRER